LTVNIGTAQAAPILTARGGCSGVSLTRHRPLGRSRLQPVHRAGQRVPNRIGTPQPASAIQRQWSAEWRGGFHVAV